MGSYSLAPRIIGEAAQYCFFRSPRCRASICPAGRNLKIPCGGLLMNPLNVHADSDRRPQLVLYSPCWHTFFATAKM